MKNTAYLLILISTIVFTSCNTQTNTGNNALSPSEEIRLEIDGQSDIAFNPVKNEYIISCFNGYVYILDSSLKILKRTFVENAVFGSVLYKKSSIYLSDDSTKRFYRIILPAHRVIDKKFRIIGISANEKVSVVGMAFDDEKDEWIIIQDLDPVRINFYDGDLRFLKKDRLNGISSITSSAAYGHFLYLLDVKGTIYKLNSTDLKVANSWAVDVEEPQGICFNEEGNIIILGGPEAMAFIFDKELFGL